MTDINAFTDRDILVRLDLYMEDVRADMSDLKERVTALERADDRRTGFLGGARWLWGIITALPVGIVAYILGQGSF